MSYSLEEIKRDIEQLSEKEFYIKYIIRSENWYIENRVAENAEDIIRMNDEYRLIISEKMDVSINSVMMVGSGKVGYSLSPPNKDHPELQKTLKPFNTDPSERKVSDLDIAIISSELFHRYWKLFRSNFKVNLKDTYAHIYQELYRGYISERNIKEVPGCRAVWNETAKEAKKLLQEKLFICDEVSFRIYRSWEDFEDYNIQNIRQLKKGMEL